MTDTEETEEKVLGDLRVRIDRTLCVGFGDCVEEAEEVFALDDDDIAVFKNPPGTVDRKRLLDACAVCPVDALEVWDKDGEKLVP